MASGGKFGWFLGLLFGATLGVLFAPRRGKDLRTRMKSDVKKGKLGISPLGNDMKELGKELADLAREIYDSESVQNIVELGRGRIQDLSRDFVGETNDFHVSRIVPAEDESTEISNKKKPIKKSRKKKK